MSRRRAAGAPPQNPLKPPSDLLYTLCGDPPKSDAPPPLELLLNEGAKEASSKGYDVSTPQGQVIAATSASIKAAAFGLHTIHAVQRAASLRWPLLNEVEDPADQDLVRADDGSVDLPED